MERERKQKKENTRTKGTEEKKKCEQNNNAYGKREQKDKKTKRTKKNKITIPRLHFEFVFHSMAHSFLFHNDHRPRQYQMFHPRSPFEW